MTILKAEIGRFYSSNDKHDNLFNSGEFQQLIVAHPLISVSYHHHKNRSGPYVPKEAIYSGGKRLKTCLEIAARKIHGGALAVREVQ